MLLKISALLSRIHGSGVSFLLLPPINVVKCVCVCVCVCLCALDVSGLISLCANYIANFSATGSSGLIWGGPWDNLSLSVCDALAQF